MATEKEQVVSFGKETPEEEIQKDMEKAHCEGKLHSKFGEQPKLDENFVREEETETHKYSADVDSILNTLISSVYANKDCFLRELVSNAGDANEKRRNLALKKGQSFTVQQNIKVIPDRETKTLKVIDDGIGMDKDDLIKYLGSVGSSGTKKFKQMLEEKGEKNLSDMIGKFGLGFYSAFLVSDQVDVISRKDGEDKQYIWSSKGPGAYTVAPFHGELIEPGTHVILHISEKCKEYLDTKKIEDLVKTHSSFMGYPILLRVEVEKEVEEEEEKKVEELKEGEGEAKVEELKEGEEEAKVEELKEGEEEAKVEEEKPAKKKKMMKVLDFKRLNLQKALWKRNPDDPNEKIENKEYNEFFKSISNSWEDPLLIKHSSTSGLITLIFLLFIPQRPPFGLFEKDDKKSSIRIYLQNVLVTNGLGEELPEWTRFVTGVIASDDIPVNVSRETLQGKNSVVPMIRKCFVKKVLDMIEDLEKDTEKYMDFYSKFSRCIKYGVQSEKKLQVQKRLAGFLRYYTSHSQDKMVSLAEYVSRMKEGQKDIYVITGFSLDQVKTSPFLKKYKDFEVIFMTDPIDEFVIQSFSTYGTDGEGHKFVRITSESSEVPGIEAITKEAEEEFKPFTDAIKNVLGEQIEKVVLSPSLGETPCAVSSAKYAYSAAMEKIMMSHPTADPDNPMLTGGFMTRKVLEINPSNPVILGLKRIYSEKGESSEFKNTLGLLYQTSLLQCGYTIKDTSAYAASVYGSISAGIPSEVPAAEKEQQAE